METYENQGFQSLYAAISCGQRDADGGCKDSANGGVYEKWSISRQRKMRQRCGARTVGSTLSYTHCLLTKRAFVHIDNKLPHAQSRPVECALTITKVYARDEKSFTSR